MSKITVKNISKKLASIGAQGKCARKGKFMTLDIPVSESTQNLIDEKHLEIVGGAVKAVKAQTPRETTEEIKKKEAAERKAAEEKKAEEKAEDEKAAKDLKEKEAKIKADGVKAMEADQKKRLDEMQARKDAEVEQVKENIKAGTPGKKAPKAADVKKAKK